MFRWGGTSPIVLSNEVINDTSNHTVTVSPISSFKYLSFVICLNTEAFVSEYEFECSNGNYAFGSAEDFTSKSLTWARGASGSTQFSTTTFTKLSDTSIRIKNDANTQRRIVILGWH